MKPTKYIISFLVIALAAFMIGCYDSNKKKMLPLLDVAGYGKPDTGKSTGNTNTGNNSGTGSTVADNNGNTGGTTDNNAGSGGSGSQYVNDQNSSGDDFNYNTSKPIDVSLTVKDADSMAPISQVIISVYNEKDELISGAVTNAAGVSDFSIAPDIVNKGIVITVKHDGYGEFQIPIANEQELAKIERYIMLRKIPVEVKPLDSDGDGVADADDEFKNDARYVKAVKGEYTLAFEDKFFQKGEADFNDAVIKLTFEERINAQNKVAYVKVTAVALASGAGYHNQFAINILGKKYVLINDLKDDLKKPFTEKKDKKNDKCVPGVEHSAEIVLDVPVDRDTLGPMPYDPFLIPEGGKLENRAEEIHLSFVESVYKAKGNKVLDNDGFPWALVVPGNWCWPYESVDIRTAYPQFQTWYTSQGKSAQDWYLHPNTDEVYCNCAESSGLANYIIGVGRSNKMVLIGGLVLVMISIGGVFIVKKIKRK